MNHVLFGKAVRLVFLASLAFAILNTPVAARTWEIEFWPSEFTIAKLRDLEPGVARASCPVGFRPMRLSTQIDLRDTGELTVNTSSPEHYKSTKIDTARVRNNLNLILDVDLTGCAYSKHFLPQSGHVDVSGVFGTGDIKPTRLHFQAAGGENNAGIWYTAQLSGAPRPRRVGWSSVIEPPAQLSVEKTLGILGIGVSDDPFSVLSGEYEKDFVEFKLRGLRVFVVSDD
ncbi:hypothetical protein [Ruegeria sp. EL01]|jgi:hypothetical protein|uniref:hypothetical protein n=1 Tax=Ruegeria sp. EL01 TaxID=2107578 RepID=UPI000EA81B3B|nr:hypothetical protein [Ruegeria sp. EL01]